MRSHNIVGTEANSTRMLAYPTAFRRRGGLLTRLRRWVVYLALVWR